MSLSYRFFHLAMDGHDWKKEEEGNEALTKSGGGMMKIKCSDCRKQWTTIRKNSSALQSCKSENEEGKSFDRMEAL